MTECIFCKIIKKEINANIIAENEFAIAFLDLYPLSKGHTLVIPKKHFDNFSQCDSNYLSHVMRLSQDVVNILMQKYPEIKGFNYLSNQNAIAGQVINHFHFHIIPKYSENDGLILKK